MNRPTLRAACAAALTLFLATLCAPGRSASFEYVNAPNGTYPAAMNDLGQVLIVGQNGPYVWRTGGILSEKISIPQGSYLDQLDNNGNLSGGTYDDKTGFTGGIIYNPLLGARPVTTRGMNTAISGFQSKTNKAFGWVSPPYSASASAIPASGATITRDSMRKRMLRHYPTQQTWAAVQASGEELTPAGGVPPAGKLFFYTGGVMSFPNIVWPNVTLPYPVSSNNFDQIVGNTFNLDGGSWAFYYPARGATKAINLTTVPGMHKNALAAALNDVSQISGTTYDDGDPQDLGYIWSQKAGVRFLQPVKPSGKAIANGGGLRFTSTYPNYLTRSGLAAGEEVVFDLSGGFVSEQAIYWLPGHADAIAFSSLLPAGISPMWVLGLNDRQALLQVKVADQMTNIVVTF